MGNGKKISLKSLVFLLEKNFKKKFKVNLLDKQTGDIKDTLADITKAKKDLEFKPKISFMQGIKKFTTWFNLYHKK